MADPDSIDKTVVLSKSEADSSLEGVPAGTEKKRPGNMKSLTSTAFMTVKTGIFRTGFFSTLLDVDEAINRSDEQFARSSELDLNTEELLKQKLPDIRDFYESLGEPFSEGGQAFISEGRDKALKRVIAIKTLRPELKDNKNIRSDFLAEAQLTSQLEHPCIVPIYSVNGDERNGVHIGMKLIKGKTLKLRLKQIIALYQLDGMLKYDENKSVFLRLERFLSICDAVSYAHSKKIMHCDLKPENIMIGEYNETYVMDWGIAKTFTDAGEDEAPATSKISGTPKYLSPEAIMGKRLDQRADVHALGLILFELVTLEDAVPGDTPQDAMRNIRDGILNPILHRFGWPIPEDLSAIIAKATETDRSKRYQSVAALADDVRRFMNHSEVSANPDGLFGKCARWIYRNNRTVIILVAFLLIVLTAIAAHSFYARMKAEEGKNVIQSVKGIAFGNASIAAFSLETNVLRLEKSLEGIASIASLALSPGFREHKKLEHFRQDGSTNNFIPERMEYSKAYRQNLGLDGFSFKLPAGAPFSAYQEKITRLNAITDYFRKSLFESAADLVYTGENRTQCESLLLNHGFPIKKILLAFADGLMISYPATCDYAADYDPRKRNWYKSGLESKKLRWEGPYVAANKRDIVITCSVPLTGVDGKTLGVVAVDVSFDYLAKRLNELRSNRDTVEEKMLLDQKGNIVLHSDRGYRYTADDGESVRLVRRTRFPDYQLFREIMSCGNGGILIRNEKESLKGYVFFKLEYLPFIYLEKINFGKLRGMFEQNAVRFPRREKGLITESDK